MGYTITATTAGEPYHPLRELEGRCRDRLREVWRRIDESWDVAELAGLFGEADALRAAVDKLTSQKESGG